MTNNTLIGELSVRFGNGQIVHTPEKGIFLGGGFGVQGSLPLLINILMTFPAIFGTFEFFLGGPG